MVRYRYNAQVDPPAPYVHVTLTNPAQQNSVADLPAQLDTAADVTVLPGQVIDNLGLTPIDVLPIVGPGGHVTQCHAFLIEIALKDLTAVTIEAIGSRDEPYILLGRDVLNCFRVVLDGPKGVLEIE